MTKGCIKKRSEKPRRSVKHYRLSPSKVKKARAKLGLSLSQLGAMIGVTKTSVNMYEAGENNPSLPMFFKLCYALKCNPTDLCIVNRGRPKKPAPITA